MAFKAADIVAAQTKTKSHRIVAQWLSDNVTIKVQAKKFFATHKLNPFQFAAWIDTYEEPNKARDARKREVKPEALKALLSTGRERMSSSRARRRRRRTT